MLTVGLIKHLKFAWCVLVLSPSFSCPTFAQHSQLLDEQVREIARKTVSETGFLSIHRREDLEDIWHSVSVKGAPEIFEVSDEGYEFKQNSVDYHFSVHGPFVRLVAVAPQTGDSFRISGFQDAQNEFNRLAKTYEVKVRNELQARDYANLYLQVDPLHYRIDKIQSLLSLKQVAEKKFADINQDS